MSFGLVLPSLPLPGIGSARPVRRRNVAAAAEVARASNPVRRDRSQKEGLGHFRTV